MTRAEAADLPAPPRPRGERRHELDALRVLAVLALLLYHASRPFDAEVWHVKNVERSLGLELFGSLLTPWRRPRYPFYIWHQTVIVVVAYFIVGWAAAPLMKFTVISAISLG